jgi:hypothetical protein
LNNLNFWIVDDMAATVLLLMPHDVGFKNSKEALMTDLVTMRNGASIGAKMIVQLPGVVCDKKGHELQEAVLDDVTYLPGTKYNLFSLSKMTRHGIWKLSDDKEALWIEKDGQEIHFNIIIPTPKGALCTACTTKEQVRWQCQ